MVQRWEYHSMTMETHAFLTRGVIDLDALNAELDEFGADGWELVSCVAITGAGVGTARVLCVFKRPVA